MNDFRQELVDRFGALPAPADHLLLEAELRILSEHWMITRLHVEDEFLVLSYKSPKRIEALAKRHPAGTVRIVDGKASYVPLGDDRSPGAIASLARDLLAPPKPVPKAVAPPPKTEKATEIATPEPERSVPVRQGLKGRARRQTS